MIHLCWQKESFDRRIQHLNSGLASREKVFFSSPLLPRENRKPLTNKTKKNRSYKAHIHLKPKKYYPQSKDELFHVYTLIFFLIQTFYSIGGKMAE